MPSPAARPLELTPAPAGRRPLPVRGRARSGAAPARDALRAGPREARGRRAARGGKREARRRSPLWWNGCFAMLSTGECDDVWCVDPRGVLTLLVAKETYEVLGLGGARAKAHRDRFVLRLALRRGAECVGTRARWDEAMRAWDARRERAGLGAWGVVCAFGDGEWDAVGAAVLMRRAAAAGFPGEDVREVAVACEATTSDGVYVPSLALRCRPSAAGAGISDGDGDDDVEDWNAEAGALFEWVGMASLGSQRLHANDRVDPYVALYAPPGGSRVGSVTRLRWTGLISGAFLQSVIDTAIAALKTLSLPAGASPFVAITAHACAASPVSYVPPAPAAGAPTRPARADGEDTWCLLATPRAGEPQSVDCALVESLGGSE
ncbi:hypothetical protein C0993_012726 [Termitomyces sp. T159_Od127]|nr:hypothetical protein C0993_012726 [Termitomyces sp. T159_Od127]